MRTTPRSSPADVFARAEKIAAAASAAADVYERMGLHRLDPEIKCSSSGDLEQVARQLDRAAVVVQDLQTANSELEKAATALVAAVKLAQDGLIDPAEILKSAQEAMRTGSADTAARVELGQLIGPEGPK